MNQKIKQTLRNFFCLQIAVLLLPACVTVAFEIPLVQPGVGLSRPGDDSAKKKRQTEKDKKNNILSDSEDEDRSSSKLFEKVRSSAERRADKDNDGYVSQEEKEIYLKGRSKAKRPSTGRAWRSSADSNQDGRVSQRERKQYDRSRIDTNGDGKINRRELRKFRSSRR